MANESMKTEIGRNDLCPCMSGKKYKKCCLEKDLQKEREALEKSSNPVPEEATQDTAVSKVRPTQWRRPKSQKW